MSSSWRSGTITDGRLAWPMLKLAGPVVVTQLLQVTYNLADALWLGRLSADAVAIIGVTFPLVYLMISVGGGLSVAGNTLVAQYTGAENDESATLVAGQTVFILLSLGVVLGLAGHLQSGEMLGLLPSQQDTAAQVIPLANDYMRVFFLGLPFLFGYYAFSALLRGHGNTRTPMKIMAVSVGLNVVLDPIFIFGWGPVPRMETGGAAAATVLSRATAMAVGMYVLFGTEAGPDVGLSHLVPDLGYASEILRIGVPSAIEQSQSALAMIVLTAMAVTFSPAVLAAYGLGSRIVSMIYLPARGLGRATNTIVGQNLGASNPERAERAVWLAVKIVAVVLIAFGIVVAAFPRPILRSLMGVDTPQAEQTIRFGTEYLRVRAAEFAFLGVLEVILGAFRGAGNTKTALGFAVVTKWVGRVPIVYVLSFVLGFGASGLWLGKALGDVLGSVAAAGWFWRGTWKNRAIDDSAPTGTAVSDGEVEAVSESEQTD